MATANPKRFLGLELGGSRRTAVVCLEYHPADRKVFHRESHAHLHGTRDETADEAVLRVVNGFAPHAIAVDAPLTLPPCFPGLAAPPWRDAALEWMRNESEQRRWSKAKFPPPYTHRPVDLLLRGRWQDDAPMPIPAEEAFGSGRAPLAARMAYLRERLTCRELTEVSPRFALAGLAEWYGLSPREMRRARDLEHGPENRFLILNKIAEKEIAPELPRFQLYMTDVVGIAKDLNAFDAFLCAMMLVFGELGLLEAPELPPEWGRVARPRRREKRAEVWEQ